MQYVIQFPVEVRDSKGEEREGTFLVQFRVQGKSPKDAANNFQKYIAVACTLGVQPVKE